MEDSLAASLSYHIYKKRKGGIKTGREEEREVMKEIENLTESYRDGEAK